MVQIKPLAHLRPLLRLPHHSSPHHAHVLSGSGASSSSGAAQGGDALNFASNPSLWQHLAGGQGHGSSVTGLVPQGGLGAGVGGSAQGGAKAGAGGQGWGAGSRGTGSGGYTGSARAFISLPQTSIDPVSSLGLTDGDRDRRRRRSSLHRPLQLPSRSSKGGSDVRIVDLTDDQRVRTLRREITAGAATQGGWRSIQLDEREREAERASTLAGIIAVGGETSGLTVPPEPRLGRIELPPLTPQLEQSLEQLEAATHAPSYRASTPLAPFSPREGEIHTRSSTPTGRRPPQTPRPRGPERSRSTLDIWRVGVAHSALSSSAGQQLRTYSSSAVRADEQSRPSEVDAELEQDAWEGDKDRADVGRRAGQSGSSYGGMDLAGLDDDLFTGREEGSGEYRGTSSSSTIPASGSSGRNDRSSGRRQSFAATGQFSGWQAQSSEQGQAHGQRYGRNQHQNSGYNNDRRVSQYAQQTQSNNPALRDQEAIDKEVWALMGEAYQSRDDERLRTIVNSYLHLEDGKVEPETLTEYPRAVQVGTFEFALVFDFYASSRRPGQAIGHVLDLYNQMLDLNIRPNVTIYRHLIKALRQREVEVWDETSVVTRNDFYEHKWELKHLVPRKKNDQGPVRRALTLSYQEEKNLASAVRLWHAARQTETAARGVQRPHIYLPPDTIEIFLTAGRTVQQGAKVDVDTLYDMFKMCRDNQWIRHRALYGDMMLILGYTGRATELKAVWAEFRQTRENGAGRRGDDWKIDVPREHQYRLGQTEEGQVEILKRIGNRDVETWGRAIEALVVAGEKEAAMEIVEEMRAVSGSKMLATEQEGQTERSQNGAQAPEEDAADVQTQEQESEQDAASDASAEAEKDTVRVTNFPVYDHNSTPTYSSRIRMHYLHGLTSPSLLDLPHLSKEYVKENVDLAATLVGTKWQHRRNKAAHWEFWSRQGLSMVDALIRAGYYIQAWAIINYNLASSVHKARGAWSQEDPEVQIMIQRFHIGLTHAALQSRGNKAEKGERIGELRRLMGLIRSLDVYIPLSRFAIKAFVAYILTENKGFASQAFLLLREHQMDRFEARDANLWKHMILDPNLKPSIAYLFLPAVSRLARDDPALALRCIDVFIKHNEQPENRSAAQRAAELRDGMMFVNIARLFGSFGPAPLAKDDKTTLPEEILDGSMDGVLETLFKDIFATGRYAPLLEGHIQAGYAEHTWAFNLASVLKHRFGPERAEEMLLFAFGRDDAVPLLESISSAESPPPAKVSQVPDTRESADSSEQVEQLPALDLLSETEVDSSLATPPQTADLGVDPDFLRPASPNMRRKDEKTRAARAEETGGRVEPAQFVMPPRHPAIANADHLELSGEFSNDLFRLAMTPPHPSCPPYHRLIEGLQASQAPSFDSLARVIHYLGRLGDHAKVRECYTLGQYLINSKLCPKWNSKQRGWEIIENAFIMALCAMGSLEEAGLHRARLLESGAVPSADAYASMIAAAKDTTDDALVAREMWDEAMANKVEPNLFLYNTIISKLSRARKAEMAIALFRQMKLNRIVPSSVTYGAVINACCRVGDEESASVLFNEMISQRNFKPRVPPYNTMMQFHLSTSPNRDKVLYYYQMLRRAGQRPSEHTYKLLLDAYSVLPPLDLPAVESVFAELSADPRVEVQGTHWASLIIAYGIYGNDIPKSLEIFDSIPTHPGTKPEMAKEPVVWEAILTIIANKGTFEQLEAIVQRMRASGARSTAYVYNVLIAGYTRSGRIDLARSLFASMDDAPMGVAAPNNHPQLLTSSGHLKPSTHTDQPTHVIYREPSTYEAMIRAELAAGNRAGAEEVLRMMQTRRYPPAVFLRASSLITPDPANEFYQPPVVPFMWGLQREDLQAPSGVAQAVPPVEGMQERGAEAGAESRG